MAKLKIKLNGVTCDVKAEEVISVKDEATHTEISESVIKHLLEHMIDVHWELLEEEDGQKAY